MFYYSHGATFRYPTEIARLYRAEQVKSPYRCSYLKRIRGYPSEMCQIGAPKGEAKGSALVLGDSHADQLDEMIAAEASKRGFKTYLTTRNCTLDNYGSSQFCSYEVLNEIIAEMGQRDIGYVFAIAYTSSKISKNRFKKSLNRLSKSGSRQVFLMNTVPQDRYFDPGQRIENLRSGKTIVAAHDIDDYHASTDVQRRLLKHLAAGRKNVTILDPGPYICPNGECDFERGGKPLYFDSNHLSPTGAEALRPLYGSVFDRIVDSGGQASH